MTLVIRLGAGSNLSHLGSPPRRDFPCMQSRRWSYFLVLSIEISGKIMSVKWPIFKPIVMKPIPTGWRSDIWQPWPDIQSAGGQRAHSLAQVSETENLCSTHVVIVQGKRITVIFVVWLQIRMIVVTLRLGWHLPRRPTSFLDPWLGCHPCR